MIGRRNGAGARRARRLNAAFPPKRNLKVGKPCAVAAATPSAVNETSSDSHFQFSTACPRAGAERGMACGKVASHHRIPSPRFCRCRRATTPPILPSFRFPRYQEMLLSLSLFVFFFPPAITTLRTGVADYNPTPSSIVANDVRCLVPTAVADHTTLTRESRNAPF